MYHYHPDTLAWITEAAMFRQRDLSKLPLAATVKRLNEYTSKVHGLAGLVTPEEEAVRFYYLNHVFGLLTIKYEPHAVMPPEAAELARLYVKTANEVIQRLVYYTLMIITREMRHHNLSSGFLNAQIPEYGKSFIDFIFNIGNMDETAAVNHLKAHPPMCSLGTYCDGITDFFQTGGFSHSFGGKPWSVIAETLGKMVRGKITAEAFADTAFTLAHNNGPMFNKGMLYHGYQPYFYTILDIQRSGQIPQAVNTDCKHYLDAMIAVKSKLVFPKELGGYIDWYRVEALGAVQSYPTEKAKQLKYHGPSLYENKGAAKPGTAKPYYVYGPTLDDKVEIFKRMKFQKKLTGAMPTDSIIGSAQLLSFVVKGTKVMVGDTLTVEGKQMHVVNVVGEMVTVAK